ncbi:MAG: 6-phosphogluconolactonase [Bacteroidota bacterium]
MNKEVFPNVDRLVLKAAEKIAQWIQETIEERGRCCLCVAGGSTFLPIYEYLVETYEEDLDWEKVFIFWGDERAVSIMHPDSNVAMVFDTFLNEVPIPAANINIIQGAREPNDAAQHYEKELRAFFSENEGMDILLLGLGDDGHTASLFPETEALEQADRWVYYVEKDGVRHSRITLTAPFLNRSQKTLFVAYGGKKAGAVKEVLEGERNPSKFPAQLIRPRSGEVSWFLDEKAARDL